MNTGPLILLAKIDALDIVGRLPCDFICPGAVIDELNAGVLKGHPAITPDWLNELLADRGAVDATFHGGLPNA